MWQEQETMGERRERRKGMLPDRHIPWALGEQPFDCHLATDGALSEVWVIQKEAFDRSMGPVFFIKNAPRGCAARGDEVYVEHTARARKCAVSAHFIS